MEFGLEGKVAIVAAGSKGLGLASAEALAREGANVTIFSRNQSSLDQAAARLRALDGGEVLTCVADLRRLADLDSVVDTTVKQFGGVDILVNNSGGPPLGPFAQISEEQWQDALQTEVISVVHLCKLVIPHMRQRGGGRIINITTVGVKKPQPGLVLSDATRHCVTGLALNLAVELSKDNILVNTVCPGPIMTERMEEAIQSRADLEEISISEAERYWLNLIPLNRFGKPSDLGDLVAFLASERGEFITGTVTQVDGGKAIV